MSSSLDSDVFLSNDEEYLNRLAKPVTRSQLNSNQSNNNDDESDHEGTQGQDSVLQQVNLTANSEGGANPNTANEIETSYSDEQDVSLFISGLYDTKDERTGIPQTILNRINANYDHKWRCHINR